jgi:ammonium transporter Rh
MSNEEEAVELPVTRNNDKDGGKPVGSTAMKHTESRDDHKVKKPSTFTDADKQFLGVAIAFQVILLILYAISSDYADATVAHDTHDEEYGTEPFYFYAMFQDVHAMMFVGFGFLMTFLRKYGFGALTFNFIICAFGIQWGMYMFHMIGWWFNEQPGIFHVTAYKLVDGDIATAVVLISFGAVLGRTNPAQLLVMCFFELIFWSLNFYICVEYLGIVDVGGSIVVHTFGAYFGLAVSFMCGQPRHDEDNKSMYHSDIFSMIGTLFLWLYWPSFNGYFANREYYFMDRAFVNTVLGLCGSTVATFVVSRIVKKGKFDMVHIQNATLAGGVAVGAAADLYLHPAGAIGIGLLAGTLSVCGYDYLSDIMDDKLKIADTCGVHNLHGMPGIFGGIVSAVALAIADGTGVYVSKSDPSYPFGDNSLLKQAGYQIAGICVTLCIAILTGVLTALIIRVMKFPQHEFKDADNFIVPAGNKDIFRGTIRAQHFGGREMEDFDALDVDEEE